MATTELESGLLLVQRFANRPQPATKRAATTIWRDGLGGWYGEPPPPAATDTPLHYIQSEAVNAAVNAFANRIVTTPLHLYRETAGGELEEIKQHEALSLIENPNPFLTRSELFWLLVADYKLSGNAYWFLAGPKRGAPAELWRVNPRLTRLVRSKREYVAGYITEIEGELVPMDRGEVIHYKAPNPFDEFYGIGALAAAALAAQTSREMSLWNRGMFGRDFAVPAGIVNIKDRISESDYERVKAEWRASYGGRERKTAFLRGAQVEWQSIGLSQTDVDFLDGAKWEAEKIYRVFGTYHLLPAQFADDRKVNERLFLEEAAWPLLVYIAEVLTDQLLTFWGPREGTGRLVAQFEDIRPRERALDLEEQREADKGLTFNEWREARSLKPIDGGDDVLFVHVQQGQTLLAAAPDETDGPNNAPAGASDAPPDNLDSTEGLNGAQIDAALRILESLRLGTTTAAVAVELLMAMGIAGERALRMVSSSPIGTTDDEQAAVTQSPNRRTPEPDTETREQGDAQDAQDNAEERESAGNDVGDDIGESANKAAVKRELARWQEFALKRFGTERDRPFRPDVVPPYLAELVQTALDSCTDTAGIKAVFQTARGLVGGKASYGTPSGTVILRLADAETILTVQQHVQQRLPADAPARWIPREQLHITVLHSPLVDEPDFRDIFQETGFQPVPVDGVRVSTFEAEGAAVPVVAFVDSTDELRTMQAAIYARFAERGIAVSPYSDPAAWMPHITLGYVDAAWLEASGIDLNIPYAFTCRAEMLAFTRGDYVTVFSREAAPPVIIDAEPALPRAFEAGKAIQATRLEFEADFEQLLAAFRGGDIDRRYWATKMRQLLAKYGELAYRDGLTDGGVTLSPDAPLGRADRAKLNQMLAEQSQYITRFGGLLKEDGISDAQAAFKPEMWFSKSIMPLYQAGRVSADENGMALWSHNPLKQNCLTCITASGQRHRWGDWYERGILPNSSDLICRGFACGCNLINDPGPERGDINQIPLHAGKMDEHDEGEPMFENTTSLPDGIWREFARVLGRRIISLDSASDHYTLTLREEAGYYATVDDAELDRGLKMIDPSLELVERQVLDDETICIHFRQVNDADR
jgi:HK97 family phage portal protein